MMAQNDLINPLLDPASIAANRSGNITPVQRDHITLPSLIGPLLACVFLLAVPVPMSCGVIVGVAAVVQTSAVTCPLPL